MSLNGRPEAPDQRHMRVTARSERWLGISTRLIMRIYPMPGRCKEGGLYNRNKKRGATEAVRVTHQTPARVPTKRITA